MAIRIIAIGKKHEPWVAEGIERYQKRLKRPWSVEWVLLPHSSRHGHAARVEESERIVARISPDEYVVLLDERGQEFASPALSRVLQAQLDHSRNIVVVIGGAFGVDTTIRASADLVWSLSPLVFPHQLVRLLLAEQLYRVQEIAAGRPYHHS